MTKNINCAELFSKYQESIRFDCASGTMDNVRTACRNFIEFSKNAMVRKVREERVDAWRIALLTRYKQNTARLRLAIVCAAFKWALRMKLAKNNPFSIIKLPKVVFAGKPIPDEYLKQFFAYRTGNSYHDTMLRVCRCILNTGMRLREAVYLDRSTEIKGESIVLPPHRTKNRKERIIHMNLAARESVGSGPGRAFKIGAQYVETLARRAWIVLGLGEYGYRIHDLRHTAATRFYELTKDDHAMQQIFGWSGPASSHPYHHVSSDRVKGCMESLTYGI